MELIKFINNLKISVSGGWAIYVILCVAYVTIVGLLEIGRSILKWFKF